MTACVVFYGGGGGYMMSWGLCWLPDNLTVTTILRKLHTWLRTRQFVIFGWYRRSKDCAPCNLVVILLWYYNIWNIVKMQYRVISPCIDLWHKVKCNNFHLFTHSFPAHFLEILCTPPPSVCQPTFLSLADEIEAQHYSRPHAVQCQKQIMITIWGKKVWKCVWNQEIIQENCDHGWKPGEGKWKTGVSCEK